MPEPDVAFEMLSDRRDMDRMSDGVRRMAELFTDPALAAVARDPFPASYSERVRRIGCGKYQKPDFDVDSRGIDGLSGADPARRDPQFHNPGRKAYPLVEEQG